jgi:hypothetical protein
MIVEDLQQARMRFAKDIQQEARKLSSGDFGGCMAGDILSAAVRGLVGMVGALISIAAGPTDRCPVHKRHSSAVAQTRQRRTGRPSVFPQR